MGKGRGHIPIRTCISCGTKKPKKDLIRLVVDEGGLVHDALGSKKGRGTYICNTEACREQLLKNRRLCRVFRSEKPVIVRASLGKSRERINRVSPS